MTLNNLKKYEILLASKSPRRKSLLEKLNIDFKIITNIETDETYPNNLKITEIPKFLAKKKAKSYKNIITEKNILITADTIVILKNKVINKPTDSKNAKSILQSLSNNMHTVITGVCITSKQKQICFSEKSQVFFGELTNKEIEYYINKYKPFDKAGAYGIQEWIGYIGISKINGSFYNIMGLPLKKLYENLKKY